MDQLGDSGIMKGMAVPDDAATDEGRLEFEWLFKSSYVGVVRTVQLIVRNRDVAEEVTQDAFMELLIRWKKVRRYERPDLWVRRVAIRKAQRQQQRAGRGELLELTAAQRLDESLDIGCDPEVLDALRQLPPKQLAVVVLFYYEDRPMAEVAEIVGCAPATGWVHLHRARKQLAELLSEEVTDDVR